MATRIKLDTLMSKLAQSEISDEDLAQYFIIDEDQSGPFSPQLTVNPHTVIIPDGPEGVHRSALALNSANFFSRIRRQSRFNKKISNGYKGPVIVSEGDSWFQYPLLLKDTIDWLMKDYAIYSMGAAGDLLERMTKKREYLKSIKDTGASIFLFSGGGNDLVAGGALADHLEAYDSQLEAADYLKPSFQTILDDAFGHYERIFRDVKGAAPHVQVICHGYDYVIPDKGRWLGKPFLKQDIIDHALQCNIAREMMDRFNRGLLRLCATMPHVSYINCRGAVTDSRWHDELHPTKEGYEEVARLFSRQIQKVQSTKSAPVFSIPGSFGRSSQGTTIAGLVSGDPVQSAAHGSVALHVGLNEVDPDYYAGWDGKLRACENDAMAMAELSESLGYRNDVLLTREATRDAVVKKISEAAGKLDAGDMFLMTISAHGGKLPDLNHDEVNDGDDPQDETLLMYDYMIADDELYGLWSEFKQGVRIVLVADTCHSGSMVRASPFSFIANDVPYRNQPENEFRSAPRHVTTRTYFQNKSEYMARAQQYSAIKESIVNNPLTTPVKASVLNLGACRDHQLARDGDEFGAFTGALLKVWNKGRFDGNYKSLMQQITTIINSPDQTPTIKQVGAQDNAFSLQRPFGVWSAPPKFKPYSVSSSASENDLGSSVTSVNPNSLNLGSPIEYLNSEEDLEEDPPTNADLERLFDSATESMISRSADAATLWPLYGKFKEFIQSLALTHFAPDEFLILGSRHDASSDSCSGLNSFPPESIWPNIVSTARVLDTLRVRLGKQIAVTNAYRAQSYNSCIGGVPASQHLRFNALDFAVKGVNPIDSAMELMAMRDTENLFHGGIGLYNSFVHLDTRGKNATWPTSFA